MLLLLLNLNYGAARPMSISSSPDFYRLLPNISRAIREEFKDIILVNDSHTENDNEFKYVPQHCLTGHQDSVGFEHYIEGLSSSNLTKLTKSTFSALKKNHNRDLICLHDDVCVAGFNGCFDIVPTVIDLIANDKNVLVRNELFGDISQEHKDSAIKYLAAIGVTVH